MLVMLSGGIDSTIALHWTLDRGYDVECLIVHWPGQPLGERRAARRAAAEVGVPLHVAEADWLRPPPGGDPEGYIPHRNLAMYGLGAHFAARIGRTALVAGHTGEDGEDFPDASAAFFDRLESLMAAGTPDGSRIRLLLPLIHLDKATTVAMGEDLGVDLAATWSCYRAHNEPCGECLSCRERAEVLVTPTMNGRSSPHNS